MVVDHLLQTVELLLLRLIALHRTVVNAPHADGEHIILRATHLLQPFYPVLLHALTVGLIVEAPPLSHVPLAHVVAQQRFTMRSTYNDTTTVGDGLSTRQLEESRRTLVHRWPYRVGPQTQQEFKYLPIGLGTDLAIGARFKVLTAPRTGTPVLIVDEDAAIGHAGCLSHAEVAVDEQTLLSLRHDIAPPDPGRDTCHSREFQQSIGHPSTIAALDDDLTVFHVETEAIRRHLALHHFDDSLV